MFKYCQLQKNFFFHFHICDIQTVLIVFSSSTFVASKLYHWHLSSIWHLKMPIHFELSWLELHQSIVGSVVECSPATRVARVWFPDDAKFFLLMHEKISDKNFGGAGYRSRYLSHAKRALYHLSYAPIAEQTATIWPSDSLQQGHYHQLKSAVILAPSFLTNLR